MKNIYVLDSMQDWLTAAQQGTQAQEKATAAGLQQYFAGMKAAGPGARDQIDSS